VAEQRRVTGRRPTAVWLDRGLSKALEIGLPTAASPRFNEGSYMLLIAVDPHKSSHTLSVLDERGRVVTSRRFSAARPQLLLRWAQQWSDRWWAVEGARGMGHTLSQWLLRADEEVRDVPAKLVARTRELSGLGSKSDPEDARMIGVAAHQNRERLARVRLEDERSVLGLITRRRRQLNDQRTLVIGQLHELLRELGVAPARGLSARSAARACERCTPETAADAERLSQSRALLQDLQRLDAVLKENERETARRVRAAGSALTRIAGIAAVNAATILGRVESASRFTSRHHFARHNGTGPLEASSGDTVRHRLNRGGDRRLNAVLHVAAITQKRMAGCPGRAYYERKRAEGKSHREAMRCLKRRISDAVYRALVEDEARFASAR
jgi:transposase